MVRRYNKTVAFVPCGIGRAARCGRPPPTNRSSTPDLTGLQQPTSRPLAIDAALSTPRPWHLTHVHSALPRRDGCAGLGPLGLRPWLHRLRSGLLCLVRQLHGYYGRVRLPTSVRHRIRLLAFPMRTTAAIGRWPEMGSPGSRTRSVCTCQVL